MDYPWDESMVGIRRNMWLRRRRLAMFGLKKTDRILDLGCGDGLDIQILREEGYSNLAGVDISPKLLAAAKKRNPGVRFILASAQKLPFAKGTFDTVFANSVMYHVVDKPIALHEIHRVLTAGGKLCVIEARPSLLRTLYNWGTFFPPFAVIPFVRRRKAAYLAEQKAIETWCVKGERFFKDIPGFGFHEDFARTDVLSYVIRYTRR